MPSYIFNQIDSQLGGKQSDLLAQPPTPGQGQPSQGAAPGQAVEKTSDQGVTGGAGPEGTASAAAEAPKTVDVGAFKEANKDQKLGTELLSKTTGDISSKQSQLKEKANQFITKAKGVGAGDYSQDIANFSNPQSYEKIKGALSQTYTPETFSFDTNVDLSGAEAAKTQAGRQGLLQTAAKGQYTGGQSKLDEILFRKQMQEQGAKAAADKRKLDVDKAIFMNQINSEQQLAKSRLPSFQEQLKKQLRDKAQSILTPAQEKAEAENNARLNINAGSEARELAKPVIDAQLSKLQSVMDDINRTGGARTEQQRSAMSTIVSRMRELQEAKDQGIYSQNVANPEGFFSLQTPDVRGTDFVDEGQATNYNSILDLLGDGGQRLTPSKAAEVQKSFNKDAFAQQTERGIDFDAIRKIIADVDLNERVKAESDGEQSLYDLPPNPVQQNYTDYEVGADGNLVAQQLTPQEYERRKQEIARSQAAQAAQAPRNIPAVRPMMNTNQIYLE